MKKKKKVVKYKTNKTRNERDQEYIKIQQQKK